MHSPTPSQLTVGIGHRTAGHDYHEHQHQHFTGDPKCLLEMASMDELDRRALNNEVFFKRRFGFSAPAEQRGQLLALKRQWDLTDLELRHLRRAGLLRLRKGEPAALIADRLLFGYGCFLLITPIIYGLMLMAMLFFPTVHYTLQQEVILTSAVAGSGVLLWLTHFSSFLPIRILRQRGFKLGEKFVLQPETQAA